MRPLASLSLDLDNKWSYLKTHGDPGWESLPSYFDLVVPRFLEMLQDFNLRMTVFVVGQDAVLEKNQMALRSIVEAGHEIGNHSYHHEPWLQLYTKEQVELEIEMAEAAIARFCEQPPVGFRGPGFSFSPQVLQVLCERDYRYDGSTFPTFLGPLARAYYFLRSRFSPAQRAQRKNLFGSWTEGFRPLKPYQWEYLGHRLLEIPVTTLPLLRAPIHLSYVTYLSQYSVSLAKAYFGAAMKLCLWTGVRPSILLHPLDFLGCDDDTELGFFPAMNIPAARKLGIVRAALKMLASNFDVLPMAEFAGRLEPSRLRTVRLPPPKMPPITSSDRLAGDFRRDSAEAGRR